MIFGKADMVDALLEVAEIPRKECGEIVETIFDAILEGLQAGQRVEIRGLGTFRLRKRNARIGRNPHTGEPLAIPEKTVVYFKASPALLKDLNPVSIDPVKAP
jgi:integration host factor subunit beta